jgi:hypothetical protein
MSLFTTMTISESATRKFPHLAGLSKRAMAATKQNLVFSLGVFDRVEEMRSLRPFVPSDIEDLADICACPEPRSFA